MFHKKQKQKMQKQDYIQYPLTKKEATKKMYTKSATEKSSFIASRYINWWLRWCLRMTSRSSQAMRSKQAGPSTRCCVATCPPKKTQNKRRAIDLQRKYPLKLEKIQGNSTNFLNKCLLTSLHCSGSAQNVSKGIFPVGHTSWGRFV